jgi:alcohol dehydrogenase class IV|eukprot:COSAG01_NODE_2191_length_8189_cov_23.683768_9_plen_157_part_00
MPGGGGGACLLCAPALSSPRSSLRRAYTHGDDVSARADLALSSLFGGISLANAKLGAVHGFAGVLGGMFPTGPHGAVVAAMLPAATSVNLRALRSGRPTGRDGGGDDGDGAAEALRRYTLVRHRRRCCHASSQTSRSLVRPRRQSDLSVALHTGGA